MCKPTVCSVSGLGPKLGPSCLEHEPTRLVGPIHNNLKVGKNFLSFVCINLFGVLLHDLPVFHILDPGPLAFVACSHRAYSTGSEIDSNNLSPYFRVSDSDSIILNKSDSNLENSTTSLFDWPWLTTTDSGWPFHIIRDSRPSLRFDILSSGSGHVLASVFSCMALVS